MPDLEPDCGRCDALCCVLHAFDASEAFAFDKPACTVCPNLAEDNSCSVHDRLGKLGMQGCISYDCRGAGQRLTQTVFAGRSWRDDPGLLPAMDDAFRMLRRLHEAMHLLSLTRMLPLSPAQVAQREELMTSLAADRDEDALQVADGVLAAFAAFIASLREVVKPRR
jgi:hypothetical protein